MAAIAMMSMDVDTNLEVSTASASLPHFPLIYLICCVGSSPPRV
jgi:hypothetical protein